ncbi:MAG: hypothetical protein FD165_2733 [Gammaproteobacteria bacterium]|nr:MAG: hypothetical protein FD165_2733 [Gammaproteobacteria bacterium]
MTFTTAATDTLAAVQVYAANYRELPISVTRPTAVIPAKARLHGGRRGAADNRWIPGLRYAQPAPAKAGARNDGRDVLSRHLVMLNS